MAEINSEAVRMHSRGTRERPDSPTDVSVFSNCFFFERSMYYIVFRNAQCINGIKFIINIDNYLCCS